MNSLDVIFIILLAVSFFGGYRLGFVARAFSWVGLAAGFGIALLVIPWLFNSHGATKPTQVFYALAVLIGLSFIGQTAGTICGAIVRDKIPNDNVRKSDRVLGAVAGCLGLIFFAWLLFPTLANEPGTSARLVRDSTVARELNSWLPKPPDALAVLENVVGKSRFPQVFDAFRPAPSIPQPPGNIALSQSTVDRVRASTVRVVSLACQDRLQEGSGFFIADNLVVTNAHVVAGQDDTNVYFDGGSRVHATVVAFDPERDIALLHTDRTEPPLHLGDPHVNEAAAVFGHPGGQVSLRVAPATIAQRIDAVGRDIYDKRRTTRDVLVLASALRQGDSGSAVVDTSGNVVGVAFAIAPDRDGVSYALAPSELTPLLDGPLNSSVSAGSCTAG